MSNISVGQIVMEAQRIASRVKDLELLGNALLVEAESNNRLVESLRQFQDDMDSLNRISNNKSNSEMVNRIQQQNATSSEILKENRELKVCIEDYERALELVMQKYREHTNSKVLESKVNFKEVYNEKLWMIIREQREKINEMAAVMQRAATADDDAVNRELELMARLQMENNTLRELLQISKQFGSACRPIRANEYLLEEKGVQTDGADDSADELSLSGASIENANNNSVISLISLPNNIAAAANVANNTAEATATATCKAATPSHDSADNNNGPQLGGGGGETVSIAFMPPVHTDINLITAPTPNTGTLNNSSKESAAAVSATLTGNSTAAPGVTATTTTTATTGVGVMDAAKAAT